VPVTLNVNAISPAVAVEGDSNVMAGSGSEPEGAEIVNATEFDTTPKFVTVTFADPAEAISAAEMTAVRYGAGFGFACVEGGWTNVVGRAEPFQLTTEVFNKFVPFTVSVKPEGLHEGVELDDVVEDDKEVMTGGEIVNGTWDDVFPSGPTGGGLIS